MLNLLTFYKNLGFRNKLLINYAFVFIISIAIGGYISYKYAVSLIEKDVEEQLRKATRSITQLVRTAATVSTRNYLRGLVEKNIESLHYINNNSSSIDARMDAARSLVNQKIGQNGFVYCIDREGKLVVTPDRFKDPDQYSSLPIQITRREGYFEYRENDYNHLISRPKADYSKIFKPWEWTIVVSAFRDEFNQLVQIDDFKYVVLSHQFGKTGHSYILDTNGNLIIHPSKQGHNLINQYDENKQFYIKKVCQLKNGQLIHQSKDANTNQVKESLIVFNYLSEFDWIVASETYLEEFYAPLKTIRMLIITTVFVLIILLLPLTYWLSASITNPINELMNHFEIGIKGDLTIRTKKRSTDEIGLLANYFNSFMDKLENYYLSLQNEMIERSQLEREIMEISDKERYRIGQDLHDDLCPHLIGVEALCKVLVQKLSTKALAESAQVETIRNLIAESILKARNLSKGLCPVYLGSEALESSLLDLAQHTRQVFGIDCKFIKIGASVRFDQSKATNLYYIAQESILNAVKHGQATQITLKLDTSGPQISLVIEDNGKGFIEASRNRGVGLGIMKYRANVIGGNLEVVTMLNRGSKVICIIKAKSN
jgi:signal transduction histidine kinase